MPVIYLRHPCHGSKVATMDLEAQYDEQNGWERYTPDEPELQSDDLAPVLEAVAAPVNVLAGRRRRKEPQDEHHSG